MFEEKPSACPCVDLEYVLNACRQLPVWGSVKLDCMNPAYVSLVLFLPLTTSVFKDIRYTMGEVSSVPTLYHTHSHLRRSHQQLCITPSSSCPSSSPPPPHQAPTLSPPPTGLPPKKSPAIPPAGAPSMFTTNPSSTTTDTTTPLMEGVAQCRIDGGNTHYIC
jgi:hypothetical protein